jgi:hypothetical protein
MIVEYGTVALSGSSWKSGVGVFSLRFAAGGGPISLDANSCAACLRSHRLAQRIIIGFVKALDFATVETLIPDLKPRAEGFGCA